MKRIALVLAVLILILQGLALADGMFVPTEQQWREGRERSLINEPEQKAVVFFSKGTEQLIISPSYEGSASNFAWVMPVPSRPKVEILKGAIFHELALLVEPERPRMKSSLSSKTMSAPGVTVLERKTVGAYDVSVLSATDGQALVKWLRANKYHLPDKAIEPIKGYVKQGWTFVASRIKVPANAKGLRTGTLAPLRLTFKTKRPVYPMRLSSANPREFIVIIYLVLPTEDLGGKPHSVAVSGVPGSRASQSTRWTATASGYPWNRRNYPTLARLYNGEMQVYAEWCAAAPQDCTRDITWSPKGR